MTRKSSTRAALPRIAFIVEGDKDELLVEALARKLVVRLHAKAQPCFTTVPLGGSPHVMGILSIVLLLLGRGCQRVIVVFDTRTTNKRRISTLLEEIQMPLIKGGVVERVVLVPAVPSIESWVLADEEALEKASGTSLAGGVSRRRSRPEELLRELLGGWGPKEQRRMARVLAPERIRVKDASFDAFARALESALGERAHPPPAEQEPAVT
jgi:hypothetical protein